MDIFVSVLEAVLLILGLGLSGFIVLSRKILPADVLKVLSPLIIDIALPCLVFTNLLKGSASAHIKDWWLLPVWWAMLTLFLAAAGFILFYILKAFEKKGTTLYSREIFMALIYPNAIFFPLAVIPSIISDTSSLLTNHFIFTLFFPAYVFNTWFLFKKRRRIMQAAGLNSTLKNFSIQFLWQQFLHSF